MDRVVALVVACGGTATWARLRRELPRRAIETAVDGARLVRVTRGVYALPTAAPGLLAAIRLGGVASHESAASLWSLEALAAREVVHVTVPRRRRVEPVLPPVRLHWADLDESERRGLVTSPERTVVDCARTLPFAEALAITDSALRRGLVEPVLLARAVAVCRSPGVGAARRVVAAGDPRAANPFESGLRAITLEAGLPDFQPQVPVRTEGLRGVVDLGDPLRRIALEADSFEWHGGRAALDRDCRRYDELVRAGWLVLRFSWEQVMFDRSWVADVVRDAVALRSGRRGHGSGHGRGQIRPVAPRTA